MDLDNTTKMAIATQKIIDYNKQIYSLKLDLKCAEALEDENWIAQIRANSLRLVTAITVLEQEINDL